MEISLHQREHFEDERIANRVEDLIAHLSIQHKLLGAKHRQVLRDVGLLHPQLLDQNAGRHLSSAEDFENRNAGRMRKRLKDIRLKASERIGHSNILAYSNIDRTGEPISGFALDTLIRNPIYQFPNMNSDPQQHLPLSPATLHVLLALAGGDLHGYAIMLEVARHSGGQYKIGPGTLYDNLKKLLASGLVEELPEADDDAARGRRTYRLTRLGSAVLSAETDRLTSVLRHARRSLRGSPRTRLSSPAPRRS